MRPVSQAQEYLLLFRDAQQLPLTPRAHSSAAADETTIEAKSTEAPVLADGGADSPNTKQLGTRDAEADAAQELQAATHSEWLATQLRRERRLAEEESDRLQDRLRRTGEATEHEQQAASRLSQQLKQLKETRVAELAEAAGLKRLVEQLQLAILSKDQCLTRADAVRYGTHDALLQQQRRVDELAVQHQTRVDELEQQLVTQSLALCTAEEANHSITQRGEQMRLRLEQHQECEAQLSAHTASCLRADLKQAANQLAQQAEQLAKVTAEASNAGAETNSFEQQLSILRLSSEAEVSAVRVECQQFCQREVLRFERKEAAILAELDQTKVTACTCCTLSHCMHVQEERDLALAELSGELEQGLTQRHLEQHLQQSLHHACESNQSLGRRVLCLEGQQRQHQQTAAVMMRMLRSSTRMQMEYLVQLWRAGAAGREGHNNNREGHNKMQLLQLLRHLVWPCLWSVGSSRAVHEWRFGCLHRIELDALLHSAVEMHQANAAGSSSKKLNDKRVVEQKELRLCRAQAEAAATTIANLELEIGELKSNKQAVAAEDLKKQLALIQDGITVNDRTHNSLALHDLLVRVEDAVDDHYSKAAKTAGDWSTQSEAAEQEKKVRKRQELGKLKSQKVAVLHQCTEQLQIFEAARAAVVDAASMHLIESSAAAELKRLVQATCNSLCITCKLVGSKMPKDTQQLQREEQQKAQEEAVVFAKKCQDENIALMAQQQVDRHELSEAVEQAIRARAAVNALQQRVDQLTQQQATRAMVELADLALVQVECDTAALLRIEADQLRNRNVELERQVERQKIELLFMTNA